MLTTIYQPQHRLKPVYGSFLGFLHTKSYPITHMDRPLALQEVDTPTISKQTTYEGPTHGPPLPRGGYLCYSFS
jgi:hypothetical protein